MAEAASLPSGELRESGALEPGTMAALSSLCTVRRLSMVREIIPVSPMFDSGYLYADSYNQEVSMSALQESAQHSNENMNSR